MQTISSQSAPSSVRANQQPRVDLYAQVHKGLRAFLGATMVELGGLDSADTHEVKRVLDQLDELLSFCVGHIEKENHYVHPAIEARAPGAGHQIAHEHDEHAVAIQRLRAAAHRLACATGDARELAAGRLYREFSMFVAENLVHMDIEESRHNQVLWATHTDAELADLLAAMIAATSPSDTALSARWMVPHITPAERSGLLIGVRPTMPEPVFQAVLSMIRPHLREQEWRRLSDQLGVAEPVTQTGGRSEGEGEGAGAAARLVERFVDAAFIRFDTDAVMALVTPDFVAHPWVAMGVPPGPDGMQYVIGAFRTAFADARATIEDVVTQGDRVVVRYTYEGRHAGSLFGLPATQRSFRMHGILIARVEGDKVAEFWREEDMLGLQQQLGVASLLVS